MMGRALLMAAMLFGGSAAARAQTSAALPTWVQFLMTVGHVTEDGRACGFIGPEETDSLYLAAARDTAVTYDIAADRIARVLRIARDHARDVPAGPQICQDATHDVPVLRETLKPWR